MEAMNEGGVCPTDLSLSTPSRAILVRKDEVRPLSSEFTPETERQRIQQLVGVLQREAVEPQLVSPQSPEATREPDLCLASLPEAFVYPELLAGEFTRLEFPRRLKGDDLGQKVLFRDHHMRGW